MESLETSIRCLSLPSNHKYDIQDYDYIDPHYGVIVEDGEKSWQKV